MGERSIATLPSGLNDLLSKGREFVDRARLDGWLNVALGFGTSRDKTMGGVFQPNARLQDDQIAALYAHDHVARKLVEIYPKEAMRSGYCLTGLPPAQLEKVERYLRPWQLEQLFTDSAIFSRAFGGGAIWPLTNDAAPPDQPLRQQPREVVALKFYDRRWLNPFTYYRSGPKAGKPESYMLSGLAGADVAVGVIHESRLIMLPGARTEVLAQREMNWWDHSVLQVAIDAIRSGGNVWKAIELLVTDANQAVFKIKGLWAMMAGAKGDLLRTRVGLMDLTRSVARAILIDRDDEEFGRQTTTFAGLSDLDDRSSRRVASACNVPVFLIGGEPPKGLNASGDSELTWFWSWVRAYQVQELEPRIMQVLRFILGQEGSPVSPEEFDKISLKWYPLWQPTAKELAEIYKANAETAKIEIEAEMVLPEEAAISLHGAEDPGLFKINVKAREKILQTDFPEIAPKDPNADPNKPVDPNAPVELADPNAEAKDPSTGLNGAQVTAMLAIVTSVAEETLPRESGVAMIIASFPVSPENAEKIMGSVGKGFKPKAPEPPLAPFGGAQPGAAPAPPKDKAPPPNGE